MIWIIGILWGIIGFVSYVIGRTKYEKEDITLSFSDIFILILATLLGVITLLIVWGKIPKEKKVLFKAKKD